jgi:TIR domain
MSGIFISYRQTDAEGYAGWVFSHLQHKLSPKHLFIMDFSIFPGDKWPDAVRRAMDGCDVVLAIIGVRWLDARDQEGRRRLDNPDDIVRLEIKTALNRRIKIIPVLVGGATMPRADDLPDDLKSLADYQALEIRANSFDADAGQLVRIVKASTARHALWVPLSVVVIIVVSLVVFWYLS